MVATFPQPFQLFSSIFSSSTFAQIEKFLQTGATVPREERTASCHEAGHTDREGGELTFVIARRTPLLKELEPATEKCVWENIISVETR